MNEDTKFKFYDLKPQEMELRGLRAWIFGESWTFESPRVAPD